MEKQLTVVVHNAMGEDGLTLACKRGDLFRNDQTIENHYRDGYRIHDYAVMDVQNSSASTLVKVIMRK